jgi:hypothetical protein
MVKNGTFASPAMERASSVLPVPGRADQQHALRDLAAEALELLRVAQEVHDLLELGLRLVDAGDVVEGDAALLLGQQLRLGLAEAHGTPPPPCIWRMKNTQTPISSSIGNQERGSGTAG